MKTVNVSIQVDGQVVAPGISQTPSPYLQEIVEILTDILHIAEQHSASAKDNETFEAFEGIVRLVRGTKQPLRALGVKA